MRFAYWTLAERAGRHEVVAVVRESADHVWGVVARTGARTRRPRASCRGRHSSPEEAARVLDRVEYIRKQYRAERERLSRLKEDHRQQEISVVRDAMGPPA